MSWVLCNILHSTIQYILLNKLPSAMFPMQIRVSNNPSSLNTIIPVRWPLNQETLIKHRSHVCQDKKIYFLYVTIIYVFKCANLQRNLFSSESDVESSAKALSAMK